MIPMLQPAVPAGFAAVFPAVVPAPDMTSDPYAFVTNSHRTHAAMTYAVAMRATRDPELAEDVTQEAFVKLLTEARAGRYPDNTGAWLYRAVSNLVISRARRAEVARRYAPRLADLGGPDQPDVVALRREGQAELRKALAALSQDERTALVLAASGASGVEIASRLGRSHGATRALMCRARTRLRGRAVGEPARGVIERANDSSTPALAPQVGWNPVRRRTTSIWPVVVSR